MIVPSVLLLGINEMDVSLRRFQLTCWGYRVHAGAMLIETCDALLAAHDDPGWTGFVIADWSARGQLAYLEAQSRLRLRVLLVGIPVRSANEVPPRCVVSQLGLDSTAADVRERVDALAVRRRRRVRVLVREKDVELGVAA